jgi:VCBS repeat-containing protein
MAGHSNAAWSGHPPSAVAGGGNIVVASPATNPGIKVSFNNTPQAADDLFTAGQTLLTEDNFASLGLVLLNVMANDSGGNAKSLYSVDDGINSAGPSGDLLVQDAIGVANYSLHGATIKITAGGQISYDAGTLDAGFAASLQSLAAGEVASDSFTYAIRLGNGTLSWATATVQIAGVNDKAAIGGDAAGEVTEDTTLTASGTLTVTDADHGQSHAQTATGAASAAGWGTYSVDADGHWSYAVNNAAVQFLGANDTRSDSFTVRSFDGTASQLVTITIHGNNDGPLITSAAQSGTVSEGDDGSSRSASGLVTFSDADLSDTHTLSISVAASRGTASVDADGTWHYTVNDSGAIDALAAGQHQADSFVVQVDDHHGGLASQTVHIDIVGTNDAPDLQGAVPTGQVFADDSLTLSAAMAFGDVDLSDSHSVTFTPLGNNYIGTFTPVIASDSTGSGHGSVGLTYRLTLAEFQAAGGQVPDHQDYRVTIDDHHGGTSSQVVSIPLAQILSDNQGDGGGGGPNHAPTVIFSTADAFPASVLDDPSVSSLHTNGFLDFTDPDSNDPHHVQLFADPANWGTLNGSLASDTPSSGGQGQVQWQYAVDESKARPLAGGESHIDHFLFRIFDSHGDFANKQVNVSVSGGDEPPVIEGSSNITVHASAGGPINLAGSIIFDDADLSDTHHLGFPPSPDGFGGTFTANIVHDTVQGAGGQLDWSYTLDPSGLKYLGEGDSVSTTFPVTIYGNNDALVALGVPVNGPGMSTTGNITIVIDGTNDDPYFRNPPSSISESPSLNSNFGVHRADNIGFGDFDNNDTHIAFAQFDAAASSTATEIGHFAASVTDDATGGTNVNGVIHWTYDASTSDFANMAAPIREVYDIVLQDNHGGQTIQQFTVNLSPHP